MPLKGWKTFVSGIVIAALAVFSNPDMQAFIAAHIPSIGGGIGALVIILRAITSTSIFKSDT